MEFFPSLALVIVGSLGGTGLNYLVGRFCLYSAKLIKMQGSPRLASKAQRARELVGRFGPGIVLGSYFLPGFRHWVPVMAGVLKAPPLPFGLGAGLGAVLWSTAYLTLGYLMAENGVAFPATLGGSPYLAILGAAFIIPAVWLARRKWQGEKSAKVSTRILH